MSRKQPTPCPAGAVKPEPPPAPPRKVVMFAPENCLHGLHDDPDNSGMCIGCGLLLDLMPGEDPNDYRRSKGWPDVPVEPTTQTED